MQQRHKTVGLCVVIAALLAITLISVHSASAQMYMCAQDLNNDGDVARQGETANCTSTPDGQLCPISELDCVSQATGTTTPTCPSGTTLNTTTNLCEGPETLWCSSFFCRWSCPANTTMDSTRNVCTAIPTCSSGTYDSTQHLCLSSQPICPLNTAAKTYPCMNSGGKPQCSPNTCADINTGSTTTTSDTSGYTNNGTVDPNTGQCLGQLYFFNGKGGECRPSGVNTSNFDCCTMGSGGLLGFLRYCRQTEADTVNARDAKMCHSVGDYCQTSWKFLGCVQKARVYCCFNSLLGRIIQEQGRPQLKKFAPDGQWGSPNAPNCVGLKPEEFQMLDFSKIDLTEYINTINTAVSSQIQQKMSDGVNKFFNQTQ